MLGQLGRGVQLVQGEISNTRRVVEKGARLKSVLPFDVLRSRWYNLYLNPILKTEN